MAWFHGSNTSMAIPRGNAGTLRELRLRRFIGWQIKGRMQGLILLDGRREFLSLIRKERSRVGAILVESADGRSSLTRWFSLQRLALEHQPTLQNDPITEGAND